MTLLSFRYDQNQIPYDYTVVVTNRPNGLDLTDRVPEELWTDVCNTVQEAAVKTITKKRECKKATRWSQEALQTAEKRREEQGKGEKGRHTT